MNQFSIPPIHTRTPIAIFRHVVLTAHRRTEGKVFELNQEVSRELAELLLLPDSGDTFSTYILASAGIDAQGLLEYCHTNALRDRIWQKMSLFLSLHPNDAEWHFSLINRPCGVIVSAIVGHPRSMRIARDHGLLIDVAADQRNIQKFAFE